MKNLLCTVFLLAAVAQPARSAVYVSESFTGTTANDWTFVNGMGDGPALTAASGIDLDGEGWLRLTADKLNQSSFVYYNQAIPTAGGLSFRFDFAIWGSRTSLADGFTLAIFNAAATPDAGGYGGSLGYAQRSGINGLAGGIVGFGFDSFGNFSNGTEGRVGGVGSRPNSIAIRGSMGADRTQGYRYITGTGSLASFGKPSAANRDAATVHSVRIDIESDKTVSILWKTEDEEEWTALIDDYQCNLVCPENIRFGFTAGTGSSYSNQEIRNISVASIPEPVALTLVLGFGCALLAGRRLFGK